MNTDPPTEENRPVDQSGPPPQGHRAEHLRASAILHVDGADSLRNCLRSRTVVVAYFDERPMASWVVMPETCWFEPEAMRRSSGDLSPSALTIDPKAMALELTSALTGVTPYAENYLAVTRWLECLFAAARMRLPFAVQDAYWLARGPADSEVARRAAAQAETVRLAPWQASAEAAALVTYILALTSAEAGRG